MINRVVLIGRLTKDPELKYTPSGVAVARFTIAINRTFSNQQGEKQADFINCVVWRKTAENIANFLRKGSLAGVEGRIQTGSYEGQDGRKIYTTEVVAESVQFLEPRGRVNDYQEQQLYNNNQSYGASQQGNYQQPSYQQSQSPSHQNYTRTDEDPFAPVSGGGGIDVTEDDLPF